jgi:dsDNA-binding SOS-regulon protein
MTFGLKNAGATYQRCMQACLGDQICQNIEVYIDDIVVKTKNAATLIDDLRETFDNLDRYKIKLNPKKCFFGVPGGQVLGYFISARGIEANPLKIKAILDMEPPKNLHQVQQLAGRLAALSRFIAKFGEKALPFYQLMKKSDKFEWTAEAHESFDNLKKILSTSPVLITPQENEPMLLYIAAMVQVFSTVLVVERAEAGKFMAYNSLFIISARYLHQQSRGIPITRSWHMPCGGQRASYDITLQSIRSSW